MASSSGTDGGVAVGVPVSDKGSALSRKGMKITCTLYIMKDFT